MYKYQIIAIILMIQIFRLLKNIKDFKKLLLSFFIISIPFEISLTILNFDLQTIGGTLGTNFTLLLPMIIAIILIPISINSYFNKFKLNNWSKTLIILIIISIINPLNASKSSTLVFSLFLLSHFIFFIYVSKNFSKEEIISGIFDGLIILNMLQFVLSICFPLLEISEVTTLFHGEAKEWSTRLGKRVGAVGTFVHPGNLALFTTMSGAFFIGCYIKNYKKKISLIIFFSTIITVILTYSRTSYIVYIIDIFLVTFIIKNAKKNILTLINVIKFIIPIICTLTYLIFFSPLSVHFLQSDTDEMFINRMIHWFMGYETFLTSPIIGVGLNSHLEFMIKNFELFNDSNIDSFFWKNPIHNIHIIVIVETGLIGFIFWLLFIYDSIKKSKIDLSNNKNELLSILQIGMIVSVTIYGLTGWAPLSIGILPFILFITFFAYQSRKIKKV